MTRWTLRFSLSLLCVAAVVGHASAESSKLNARARIALAQLRAGEDLTNIKTKGSAVTAEGELDVFITGNVSRAELEAAGARVRTELPGLFTASIPVSAVDAVEALGGVAMIQGSAPVDLELDQSVPSTNATNLRGPGPNFTGLNGAGVLVGDVDTGVDYGHDDFKDPGGLTRLVNIWDQSVNTGPNPAGFAYGTEWTPAQINANTATELDVNGHGTHVMGIIGGDGSGTGGAIPQFTYVGMAPKADLLMVKTTSTSTTVLDGVNYFFGRATALGKNAVCNLSLGSHYGPHDGSSPFEAGLDALSGPGRVIVKSAGNERGVAQHSEVFAAGLGTNTTMTISGSATNRTIAIAGYYNSTETIDVRITTPNATVIGPISLGGANAAYPGTSTANGRVYLENGITTYASGAREIYIEITPATGQNMNGTWTFTMIPVALGAANGEVDMWRFFQSTGSAGNFVTGNQSGEELISEPGNAAQVITTAAWVTKRFWTDCNGFSLNFSGAVNPGNLATFSSPGPTRDGRQKPDIAAPGAVIGSATSFDFAQSCAVGGSTNLNDNMQHTINQGTSMAAPHVTGAVALIMQKYGAVTPAFAKNFINSRAIIDGFTGAPWNKDWGNGKLYLGDMVDPSVAVLSPNGGELYQTGQNVNLTWNATDAFGGVTSVDLYLSRNGNAGPWETVATGQPNTGSYTWAVTGPPTLSAVLKVVASDAAANSGEDVSDQVWSIEEAVPVMMSILEAEQDGGAVKVRWRFGDPELSLARIERSDEQAGAYAPVAVELGTDIDAEFAIDRTAAAGTTYWYKIVGRRSNGSEVEFGPVSAKLNSVVTAFALSRIAPNPAFAGPVNIDFALPREAQVKVSILDVRGRELVSLANARYAPGVHTVSWNRESRTGAVSPGLYFVRYQTPDGDKVQRIIVSN